MTVSSRTARRVTQFEGQHLCRPCKFPAIVVVTQSLLDWWTDRYSDDEIVELAELMWGPRSSWPANPPSLRL